MENQYRQEQKIRIGIIGANPERGWAAQAHVPALLSLARDFTVTALSTSRRESARAAGEQFGVPLTFDNHHDLVRCAYVDVVVIAVKVPHHFELASAALAAGKAVYCEWPLGNGLSQALALAEQARRQGVLAVTGLQARFSPAIAYARHLIRQGYVGQVLSSTLVGSGMGWGETVEPFNAYTNDRQCGATMLTIPFGHTVDALCQLLGEPLELCATMAVRRPDFRIAGAAGNHRRSAEDQVAVNGLLGDGAAFSMHYRGGRSRGVNLLWEINGTDGDLQLSAAGGHAQIFDVALRGAQGGQAQVEPLSIPEDYFGAGAGLSGPAANVARAYAHFARDFREGTHFCATFDDAVVRHRMLDAIEQAARSGARQFVTPRSVALSR